MNETKQKTKPKKPEEKKLRSRSVPLVDADYEALKQRALPYSFGAWARSKLLS